MKVLTLAALVLVTTALSACSPAIFPGLHYALDDNADSFWKEDVWGRTGLCTTFPDGSTINCDS